MDALKVYRFGLAKLHEAEFRRYLMVGLVGIITFEGGFYLLNSILPFWVSYLVAFELVTDLNFMMHDSYTFRGEKHFSKLHRFAIFQSQAILYRLIQYSAFFLLSFILNLYLALLIAIFVAFTYSYTMNTKVTWKLKSVIVKRV